MSLSSCKKFLDTTPTDFLSPKDYYRSANELNLALAGVYDILGHNELYKATMFYYKGLEADEGYPARATFININSNDYTSSNTSIRNTWAALYNGINRANVFLANADNNPALDADLRTVLKGEAMFLRAYYYFLLVQYFGGVPLVLTPTISVTDTDVAKVTDREVYDQILKDMIAAEQVVPSINGLGFSGRITKSAVRGILARVCLVMAGNPVKDVSKYAEARKWAKMVIDDTEAGHALNPVYSDIFIKLAQDKYDVKESIWEAEFIVDPAYDAEAGSLGFNIGIAVAAGHAMVGTLGISPAYVLSTAKIYDAYENGDIRKGWNLPNFVYAANGTKTYNKVIAATQAVKYGYAIGKFRREYELSQNKSTGVTPTNFPILRFSDILLMFAEAENEINGPTQDAVNAINLVRRRGWAIGGIKAITVTNGGTTNYTSAPTITFSGGGGSGAIATSALTLGKVTTINLAPDGITGFTYGKYTSAPTVTITGGGGAGATATASIYTTDDADVPTTAKTSKEALREFLQTERSRELCYETTRKFDLVRWGIYVSAMNNVGNDLVADVPGAYYGQWYRNVQPKHVLWPIPNSEIVANKLLVQNPLWN